MINNQANYKKIKNERHPRSKRDELTKASKKKKNVF